MSLDCPFLIAPSVFSNVYLQCLWIVRSWLPLRFSLTFLLQCLCIVHFLIAPSVFSNVFITMSLDCPFLIAPSVFSNVFITVSLDCPFLIAPSVSSNVYLQCLWIVHSWLPLRFSLTFIYSVSGLSILDCPFGFL